MIRAVFLDAGGVLTLPPLSPVRAAMGEFGIEVTLESVRRAHYRGMIGHDHSEPPGDFGAYLREFVAWLGARPDQVLEAERRVGELMRGLPWTGLVEDSVRALPVLAATGAVLAVVSNSDGTVEARLREAGILQAGHGRGVPVTVVIDSGAVGVEKPDPAIFELAVRATGVPAEATAHVGDSLLTDVSGARAAGIRPLHMDPFGDCPQTSDHEHIRSLHEVVRLIGGD